MKAQFIALVLLPLFAGHVSAQRKSWHQDFRDRRDYLQLFEIEPKSTDRDLIASEVEGLRITLPGGKTMPITGVTLRKAIYGDFTITIEYELLAADRPDKGYGTGVGVYVMLNTVTQDTINFGLQHLKDDKYVWSISHKADAPKGKDEAAKTERVNHLNEHFPASSSNLRGKLRLQRIGPELTLAAAADRSTTFKEITKVNIGTANTRKVRIAADQGNSASLVDLRIIDFHVDGDKLVPRSKETNTPNLNDEPSSTTVSVSSSDGAGLLFWVILAVGSILLIAAIVLVSWQMLPKRAKAEPTE